MLNLSTSAEVKSVLKKDSILDLFGYEQQIQHIDPDSLTLKYGKEISEEMFEHHKNKLALSDEDNYILSAFSRLIYLYSEEDMVGEVIVRIPQLLAEGTSIPSLEEYFTPLMDYWKLAITPEISRLFKEHQLDCNQPKSESIITRYCIEEVEATIQNPKIRLK